MNIRHRIINSIIGIVALYAAFCMLRDSVVTLQAGIWHIRDGWTQLLSGLGWLFVAYASFRIDVIQALKELHEEYKRARRIKKLKNAKGKEKQING